MKLESLGYKVIKSVVSEAQVSRLRVEADRVAKVAGSVCVRHLRSKSEIFSDLALSDELKALLPSGSMRPVRTILFDKTPERNWPVSWHQDLTIAVKEKVEVSGYGPWSFKDGFPHVQPPVELLEGMVTIRIHLDDASSENGALKVIESSHLLGKLSSCEVLEKVSEEVVCECEAGDVLMMKPLALHASSRSVVPSRRRILHFEYARSEDLDDALEWAESR